MKRDRSDEQRTPYRWVVSVSVIALMGVALASWSGPPRGLDLVSRAWADDAQDQNHDAFGPHQTLPISLHGTKQGHLTFYSKEYGGFENVTGIAFRDKNQNVSVACLNACHMDGGGCYTCHTQPVPTVPPAADLDDRCLYCHGRQAAEAQFRSYGWLTDVHAESENPRAPKHCMDCHTKREVHGDENVYSSLLAPEAMDAKCTNCHPVKTLRGKGKAYHAIHLDDVDCSACHVQSVLACQSCHFDSLLGSLQQIFWGPPSFGPLPTLGFKLLVRHDGDGKVHAATYMTLTDQHFYDEGHPDQKTFVVIAPNHVHAVISGAELSCRDCHDNKAVQEYKDTKKIDVVTWKAAKETLEPHMGVIPVPPDWQTALHFDFVVPDQTAPGGCAKLDTGAETGADLTQILFAKPLSQEQMDALSIPRTPHALP
jgi:hypothetical protein